MIMASPGSPIMLGMKVPQQFVIAQSSDWPMIKFLGVWLAHAMYVLWLRWRGDTRDLWATQADTWHVMDATHITTTTPGGSTDIPQATLGTVNMGPDTLLTHIAANLYFTLNRKSNLTPGV